MNGEHQQKRVTIQENPLTWWLAVLLFITFLSIQSTNSQEMTGDGTPILDIPQDVNPTNEDGIPYPGSDGGSGDSSGDNSGGNAGDNSGENAGDNTGDNSGAGDNSGDSPADNPGDGSGDTPGDNSGDGSGDDQDSPPPTVCGKDENGVAYPPNACKPPSDDCDNAEEVKECEEWAAKNNSQECVFTGYGFNPCDYWKPSFHACKIEKNQYGQTYYIERYKDGIKVPSPISFFGCPQKCGPFEKGMGGGCVCDPEKTDCSKQHDDSSEPTDNNPDNSNNDSNPSPSGGTDGGSDDGVDSNANNSSSGSDSSGGGPDGTSGSESNDSEEGDGTELITIETGDYDEVVTVEVPTDNVNPVNENGDPYPTNPSDGSDGNDNNNDNDTSSQNSVTNNNNNDSGDNDTTNDGNDDPPQNNDGNDGQDGSDGNDGQDGTDGQDGSDGNDGQDGTDGQDGSDGNDGQDGTDGQDGSDGNDGNDGQDGKDAEQPEPEQYNLSHGDCSQRPTCSAETAISNISCAILIQEWEQRCLIEKQQQQEQDNLEAQKEIFYNDGKIQQFSDNLKGHIPTEGDSSGSGILNGINLGLLGGGNSGPMGQCVSDIEIPLPTFNVTLPQGYSQRNQALVHDKPFLIEISRYCEIFDIIRFFLSIALFLQISRMILKEI